MQNTECYDHNRLDTVRYSSQVCAEWRRVLMQWPSVWGRMVDLDAFRQRNSNKWAKEVMSRTGNAMLWVRGHFIWVSDATRDFLFSIISSNWRRIQKFDVYDSPRHFDPSLQEAWVNLFSQPAPSLVAFNFNFSPFYVLSDDTIWSLPSLMFNNDAPVITEFSVRGPKHIFPLRLASLSWFTHLRVVSLHQPLSVSELYETLRYMPLVEYTRAYGPSISSVDTAKDIPHLERPRLASLQLQQWDANEIILLLQCITGPLGRCGLFIPHIKGLTNTEVRLWPIVHKYMQSYLDFNMATTFSIVAKNDILYLKDHLSIPLYKYNWPSDYFSVSTNLSSTSAINSLRSFSRFPAIQELEFTIFGQNSSSTLSSLALLPPIFNSVVTLIGNKALLSLLLDYRSSYASYVFPQLRVLKFRDAELGADLPRKIHALQPSPQGLETVYRFVKHRKDDIALPISMLDLSELMPHELVYDFGDFETSHPGLVIVWTDEELSRMEYTCGTGYPEQISFTYCDTSDEFADCFDDV